MLEMSKEKMKINRKIVERKEIIFVEGDMIIPDAKPDIINTINVSGIPTIYRKETMEGKIRVDGNINTYIMYLSDEEKPENRGLNTSLDFSEIIEVKQSIEGANLKIATNINSIECKIINERKINLKAALEMKITISTDEEVEIIEDIQKENSLQILKDKIEVNSLIGRGSTKVHSKETVQIEQEDLLAEILEADIELIDKDTKISYNKILAKTDAKIKILYLTEEGEIKKVFGTVPVVGFVDLPNVNENSICDVNYELQNIIIKPNNSEEHSIYVEIETEITCEGYDSKQISVVKDLYSPYKNIEMDTKQINLVSTKKQIKEKNTLKEHLVIDELENKKLLDVEAKPIIRNENKNGTNLKVDCDMELKFILFDEQNSRIEIKEEKIPFDFSTNILEKENYTNIDLEIGNQDFVIQSNNEVSCNLDVINILEIEKYSNLQTINNIEEKGDKEDANYSVIIYIVKKEDTLWNIAKKFGSTICDIVKVNEIEDPENLKANQKIFIPRFCKVLETVNG